VGVVTILEFLEARIGEDESAALAANGPDWETPGDDGPAEGMLYANGWSIAQFTMYPKGVANSPDAPGHLPAFPSMPVRHIENGVHTARHDPARVLREVAAKREIIEAAYDIAHLSGDLDGDYHTGFLKLLAGVYSDHPDYQTDWTP
jgi:hypothetical protein